MIAHQTQSTILPHEAAVYHAASPVTRRLWGSSDAILLMFAGSAAEFALNKAVNWLFFTNALPNDPVGRFFETVRFAQAMVFGDEETASAAVRAVREAHHAVEQARGGVIPQWSHRDTLFMLVEYGERAHEVVFGPMPLAEREAFWRDSMAMGRALGIRGLPDTYDAYQRARVQHLHNHLARTPFTDQLYAQYRRHIGSLRMRLLRDMQASLVPDHVCGLLDLRRRRYVDELLPLYRRLRSVRLLKLLYPVLLPSGHGRQLVALHRDPGD
jgi:uncharacterized protein (DUF2236 family)